MAGPCSVESGGAGRRGGQVGGRLGARVLRGGLQAPLLAYSFQGYGRGPEVDRAAADATEWP